MVKSNLTTVDLLKTLRVETLKSSAFQTPLKRRGQISQILEFTQAKKKTNMTKEDTDKLKSYLTSEMVSSITLAEAINIMHSLAVQEVERNIEEMSDEEKSSALEELQSKVEEAPAENRKGETKE